MNQLKLFENAQFGSVRVDVDENGKVLFCGGDVAKALGYAVPRKAIADHCKGVLKRNTLTNGGNQEMSFIPESDVYRLAFGSKLPNAERFTDWVTEEVLPSIRKTGAYLTPEALEKVLCSPETIIRLASDLKAARDYAAMLKKEIKPFAEFGIEEAKKLDDLSVEEFGKIAHVENMWQWLRQHEYMNQYMEPMQKYEEMEWIKNERRYVATKYGTIITCTVRITGKGQIGILKALKEERE